MSPPAGATRAGPGILGPVPSSPPPPRAAPLVLGGAWRGALAWALLAVAELLAGPGAAGLRAEGGGRLLLLLAGAYALAGLGLGALGGALVAWRAARQPAPAARLAWWWSGRLAAAALLGLVAALGAHWALLLAGGAPGRARLVLLVASAGLALVGLLALAGGRASAGGRGWRHLVPWAASLPLAVLVAPALVPRPRDAGAAGLAPQAPVPESGAGASRGTNVVLVTLDTVRADHLSLYGYARPTSPRLEALAREATVFRRAIAPSTMTLATHASLFTGLPASVHGAHWDRPPHVAGRPLARELDTLAEILRAHGWRTAGIAANYGFFGPFFGLRQGFEVFDARSRVRPVDGLAPGLLAARVVPWLEARLPLSAQALRCRRGEELVQEASALLRHLRGDGRPFFLFLNLMDAHDPYLPPEPWASMFLGEDPPDVSGEEYLAALPDLESNRREVEPELRRLLLARYDGAIAYVDAQVGALVDELRALGLLDTTLLVVTSDHGESFGWHGLVGHGVSVHENQVHVPLVVRWPGGGAGREVEDAVSLLDVLPTVLEELGLPPRGGLEGRSLRAAEGGERLLVAESFPHHVSNSERGVERALYLGPWKLLVTEGGEWQLLALGAGAEVPVRRTDLAVGLGGLLQRWVVATSGRRVRRPQRAVPEEAEDALRALGYAR